MSRRDVEQLHDPAARLWQGFLEETEEPGEAAGDPHAFRGERVLLTGAGGFLGSAVARALLSRGVAHLCLLDLVEHGLYDLQQQLTAGHAVVPFDLVLGSVTDRALLEETVARYRPTLVLHTAALKHVPMLEDNALAAVATNVLGTETLLSVLRDAKVRRVVLCSTDKAVEPAGVMGATKYLAEQLAYRHAETRTMQVLRLCNVLGSTGSVAPLFAAQIARREPLTVTDREATRLWMTQREAVRCLLHSLRDELPTPLSVPRQVEERRVVDLLAFILNKADMAAPQIAFTGLRRGERLMESLQTTKEIAVENRSACLRSLRPVRKNEGEVEALIRQLAAAVEARQHGALEAILQQGVQLSREVLL